MKFMPAFQCCIIAVAATTSWSSYARADMMSACQADIGSFCSGVSNGRGRISACLFSQMSKLDATCRTEVEAEAKKDQSSRLLPAHVRSLMGAGSVPAVPSECSSDQGKFCSGVDSGERNTLACLYAHSQNVTSGCASAIQAALE